MTPVSPVVPGLEEFEVVLAKNQPQYQPLPAFRAAGPDRPVMSRWRLTDAEREQITSGADVVLTLLTFGSPPMPVFLEVVGQDDAPYSFAVTGV